MLQPDQIFAERYRVVRRLADGGMGAVFVAQHVGTESMVALKLLWPHSVQVEGARRKFELEAKVAARVKSQHIVQVLDAGLDPSTRYPYLVMELLEGQTLAARVRDEGPLPWALSVELVRQLARGLDAAHGHRSPSGADEPIVHRDLKPENLFLVQSQEGLLELKILDFGIAKVLSESSIISREVRGTPLYMACEQVTGDEPSPQTDVWALGLIAYFSLTGRSYWRTPIKTYGGASQSVFAEILALPLGKPSERADQDGAPVVLPPTFDAWLLRCLERDPVRRYPTAGAAATALAEIDPASVIPRAVAAGEPASAPQPARPADDDAGPARPSELGISGSFPTWQSSSEGTTGTGPSLPAVTRVHVGGSGWPMPRRQVPAVFLSGLLVGVVLALALWVPRKATDDASLVERIQASRPEPAAASERAQPLPPPPVELPPVDGADPAPPPEPSPPPESEAAAPSTAPGNGEPAQLDPAPSDRPGPEADATQTPRAAPSARSDVVAPAGAPRGEPPEAALPRVIAPRHVDPSPLTAPAGTERSAPPAVGSPPE